MEVPAFEQLLNGYEPRHVPIIAAPVGVCTRALQETLPDRGNLGIDRLSDSSVASEKTGSSAPTCDGYPQNP